jgi:glycosidase
MTGFTNPNDGYVRQDFPGGWPSDRVNKFTREGRSVQENEIWDHIAVLANYRKTSSAITSGKMMQFVPEDGVYVYFRYDKKQTVMVAMNTTKEKKNINISRFAERTRGFSKMKNVLSDQENSLSDFSVLPWETVIFELMQ